MAIIELPTELQIGWPLVCAICRVPLSLDKATAGFVDADNRQAFACVSHFSEIALLLLGWANFIACERRRYLQHDQKQSDLLYGGRGSARFNF